MREQNGFLTGHDGLRLFYRTWEPDEVHGSIVLVHGTNEHIGRYEHVADYFARQGFAVYGLDLRGYGQSEGAHCYVNRFDDYLVDLKLLVDVASQYGVPILIGHSLGGLIAFRYALKYANSIKGLIISSPFFQNKVKPSAVEEAMAPLLSAVWPKLQLPVPIPASFVSRSEAVVAAYAKDPLVWTKATPRWYMEVKRAAQECRDGLANTMRVPILFLQAGDDRLIDPAVTRQVYDLVPTGHKTFKLYAGKYHEIFNDPGYEEVFGDIMEWVTEQELA
jgi:lysophospholipase